MFSRSLDADIATTWMEHSGGQIPLQAAVSAPLDRIIGRDFGDSELGSVDACPGQHLPSPCFITFLPL